jgi:hypothetical protein
MIPRNIKNKAAGRMIVIIVLKSYELRSSEK